VNCPEGMTEDQVLGAVEKVIWSLAPKFVFGSNQLDDALQNGRVFALELLAIGKFDPARGPLEAYLYRHVFRRFVNQKRNLVKRTDPPCAACYRGQPCGPEGKPCPKFAAWDRRQHRKASLSAPAAHGGFEDGRDPRHLAPAADEEAERNELLRLIDERLDADHRRLLLQMRDGVVVPKKKRLAVQEAVVAILAEAGVSREELGLTDDDLDEDAEQAPPTAA